VSEHVYITGTGKLSGLAQEEEVRLPPLKVFHQWDLSQVEVRDPGLRAYIALSPVVLPHSGGRHEHRRFGKARVNVVERLANMLMRPGKNGGKKQKALLAVKNALHIIHLRTGENPVQVLVRAIENAAPREDTTRVTYGGITYFKAVDISPQRRLDLALRWLAEGARLSSFRNVKTIGGRSQAAAAEGLPPVGPLAGRGQGPGSQGIHRALAFGPASQRREARAPSLREGKGQHSREAG
jgi:small subunit ribosomal protein S7